MKIFMQDNIKNQVLEFEESLKKGIILKNFSYRKHSIVNFKSWGDWRNSEKEIKCLSSIVRKYKKT